MINYDKNTLSQKSQDATLIEAGEIVVQLIEHLEKLDDPFGLAAIQIGIPKRVFVTKNTSKVKFDTEKWVVWVNPHLLRVHGDKVESIEGCFSLPNNQLCRVKRYEDIEVSRLNLSGNQENFVLTDQDAIVFQHEIDHLNGLLISDVGEIMNLPAKSTKIAGRNDLCPCGSKLKFKKCCGN